MNTISFIFPPHAYKMNSKRLKYLFFKILTFVQKNFEFRDNRFILNASLVTAISFIILFYITPIDFQYNSLVLHLLGNTNYFYSNGAIRSVNRNHLLRTCPLIFKFLIYKTALLCEFNYYILFLRSKYTQFYNSIRTQAIIMERFQTFKQVQTSSWKDGKFRFLVSALMHIFKTNNNGLGYLPFQPSFR